MFQGKASGDGFFGFQYLRSLVFFHTLDMKQALPQYLPFFGIGGPGHHMPNRCPFGPVLVQMPFYLVACALHWLCGVAHHPWAQHLGESAFEMWVTGLATLAAVLVGWRQTFVLVERHAGRDAARIGSIAAVWATPIAWYAVTQPTYQHGLAFFFVAVLVEYWDRTFGDASWRRMLVLGAVGGAGHDHARAGGAVAALARRRGGVARRRRARAAALARAAASSLCAATLVAFAPQMAVWWYYTGSPLHPAQIEPLRPTTPFFVVSLFSTRGGLFPWSPVAYASLARAASTARARARVTLALLAVYVLEIYVVSSAWVVTGGYGYGARRLSDGAVLMALGLGLLWARAEARRRGRGGSWPRSWRCACS